MSRRIALAEKLKEMAPVPGGQGVLRQFRLARPMTARSSSSGMPPMRAARRRSKKIIARNKAYHGVTLASAIADRAGRHSQKLRPAVRFRARMPNARIIIAAPSRARASSNIPPRLAADLDALIQREGPDTIAAMIVEAGDGRGRRHGAAATAISTPSRQVLDKYGIPLIDDEVITRLRPHRRMVRLRRPTASSPTACRSPRRCHRPICRSRAVLLSPELTEIIEAGSRTIGGLWHGFTYSGHPVAAAVALKTLEIYETPRHCRPCAPCRAACS